MSSFLGDLSLSQRRTWDTKTSLTVSDVRNCSGPQSQIRPSRCDFYMQTALEAYLIGHFEYANLCALQAKNITIMPKDNPGLTLHR